MKRIYDTIKYNGKLYLMNTGLLLGIYMITMNFQITSDVLYSEMIGELDHAPSFTEHIASGRYTNYLISWFYRFLNCLGVNKMHYQWVLQLLGILVYSAAALLLYRMFEKAMKLTRYSLVLNALILVCFVNPFIVETFVYVAFDWAVGILLAVLAAQYITEKRYVIGWILAFLAVSAYQSNIIMTLQFCIAIIFITEYDNIRQLIKRVFISGLLCVSAAGVNILIPKLGLALHVTDEIVKQTGVQGAWSERIYQIKMIIWLSIVKAYGMLPNYFIPLVILLAWGTTAIIIWKNADGYKKFLNIVLWSVAVLSCILVPYAPCFVSTIIGYPQRTLISMFVGFSMILICCYYFLKDTGYLSGLFAVGTALGAAIMVYSTQTGLQDCYIANAMDFHEARQIQEAIDQYETETGNEIHTIVVHRMGSIHYIYEEQHFEYVYTLYAHRLFYDAWADVNLLNYMFDKDYERVNMDELYTDNTEYYQSLIQQYWEGKSWTHLNTDEQLVFDGNTMYWALY